jgi:hypothetical protein
VARMEGQLSLLVKIFIVFNLPILIGNNRDTPPNLHASTSLSSRRASTRAAPRPCTWLARRTRPRPSRPSRLLF